MGTQRIEFVCVRAAHHRRQAMAEDVCEFAGFLAYCPAGDIGGHEWMAAPTDLATLTRVGLRRAREAADDTDERHPDMPELIHG